MNIDFPLILVLLTAVTGFIWLVDALVFKPRRLAQKEAGQRGQAGDAGNAAENADEEEEDDEPYLVELSRSFFPVLAIVLVLRSFLAEPFQIPSGSMLPTLEVGDFILVNKFAYGIRLPVARTEIVEVGRPQRGDVMVFKHFKAAPGTGVDSCRYNPNNLPAGQSPVEGDWVNYIKRVVGVPGDRVSYRDKTLYINGEEMPLDFIAQRSRQELYMEALGDVRHRIFRPLGGGGGEGEWVVPEGHYFVMGDNRGNSCDSRFWGFVPDRQIVGRAFAIWMHWDLSQFPSLPGFSRVGGIE